MGYMYPLGYIFLSEIIYLRLSIERKYICILFDSKYSKIEKFY